MKLIETNSKYRGINGNTEKDNEGSINGRYDPYHMSESSEMNEMSSKNLIEYILHEKSALMLSNPFSFDSTLNIKVSGGSKKTTPPTPKKEKFQKVNGRTKRRRSQSSHDDVDYYDMKDSNKGVGNDSNSDSGGSTVGQKNNQYSEGSGGEKWGRGKSSRNEENKNLRKKYYDNTYSSNKSYHNFGKGISNTDISDELEIPIGQWIAILCALIGIAYHHFNLGKKIPEMFKSKNESITKKKLTTGKKNSSGSKKGKKRGNNSNTSKGRRGKPQSSKILNESVDSDEHSMIFSQLSSSKLPQISKSSTKDLELISKSSEKKLENYNRSKEQKVEEESIKEKVIHVQKSLDENPVILTKAMEKKKTVKKKKKKVTKPKPRLESNTPDSVSTDGSSSTEEVDISYDHDQIMPLAELGFNEKDVDDEGEWTLVGASSNDLSSRVSNVDSLTSSTKKSESIPNANCENDSSKVVDELKVKAVPEKQKSLSNSQIDINDNEKVSNDCTTSQQLSSTADTKDIEKEKEHQETKSNHIDSISIVNSEEDDAAYARMLQKQEEEMVAANEKKNKMHEEQGWKEVKKKKRSKKTQDAA